MLSIKEVIQTAATYEVIRELSWMLDGLTEEDFMCECGCDYRADYDLGRQCVSCEVGLYVCKHCGNVSDLEEEITHCICQPLFGSPTSNPTVDIDEDDAYKDSVVNQQVHTEYNEGTFFVWFD